MPLFKPTAGGDGLRLRIAGAVRRTAFPAAAFRSTGQFHPSSRTSPGEPFPLHGDGFQKPWRVARSADRGRADPRRRLDRPVSLCRERPLCDCSDGALTATLTVENRAPMRLALWPRLPSLVSAPSGHDALRQAPSVSGLRTSGICRPASNRSPRIRHGIFHGRAAARRLDQQWL